MDPNSNLKEMLELAADLREAYEVKELLNEGDVDRLAELVEALDGWLSKGGFLPSKWDAPRGPR